MEQSNTQKGNPQSANGGKRAKLKPRPLPDKQKEIPNTESMPPILFDQTNIFVELLYGFCDEKQRIKELLNTACQPGCNMSFREMLDQMCNNILNDRLHLLELADQDPSHQYDRCPPVTYTEEEDQKECLEPLYVEEDKSEYLMMKNIQSTKTIKMFDIVVNIFLDLRLNKLNAIDPYHFHERYPTDAEELKREPAPNYMEDVLKERDRIHRQIRFFDRIVTATQHTTKAKPTIPYPQSPNISHHRPITARHLSEEEYAQQLQAATKLYIYVERKIQRQILHLCINGVDYHPIRVLLDRIDIDAEIELTRRELFSEI